MQSWRSPMPQVGADAGIATGGLTIAAALGTINTLLQTGVLVLTLVAIAYRIRNERRKKAGQKSEDEI